MKLSNALLGGLIALLSTTSAAIAQWYEFRGSNCKTINKFGDYHIPPGKGYFANAGGSSMFVACPLAADETEGDNSTISEVRVNVWDASDTVDGFCRVVSRPFDGKLNAAGLESWQGTGMKVVLLGPLDAGNVGSYELFCRLPRSDPEDGTRGPSYVMSYALNKGE